MFIFEISILNKSHQHKAEEILDAFNRLMSYYWRNGQTQGRMETQYVKDRKVVALPYCLENDSLAVQHNNEQVNQQIKRLESLCEAKLSVKLLGTETYHDDTSPVKFQFLAV